MTFLYQLAYTMQGAKWFVILAVLTASILWLMKKFLMKKAGNRLGTCFLLAGLIGVYISVLLGYAGKYDNSMWVYSIALLCVQTGYLFNIIIKKKYDFKNALQMFLLSTFFAVFFLAAAHSNRTIKEYPSLITICCLTAGSGFIFWLYQVILNIVQLCPKIETQLSMKILLQDYLKKRKWLLILLLITFVFSFDTLKAIPMWDGADYMQAISNASRWEFSLGTIAKFDLCYHKAGGYALFAVLGTWIFQNATLGVHFVQLIMSMIAVSAFWKILDSICPQMEEIERALFTSLFAFAPAFLGLMPNINVDFAMLIFMIWFLCCYYNGWKILSVLCALLLCFTKESALFVYVGFAVGVYITRLIKCKKKGLNRLIGCMSFSEYTYFALPVIIWLTTFIFTEKSIDVQGAWGASIDNYMNWNGKVIDLASNLNSFGYSFPYILNQAEHLFLMNFLWIFLIAILIAFFYHIINEQRRKMIFTKIKSDICIPLIASILFFCMILFFYITHNHYRYVTVAVVVVLLCYIYIFYALVENGIVRKIFIGLLVILFLFQSFLSVDPITNMMGKRIDTGNGFVVNFDIGMAGGSVVSDYIAYNRQSSDWGVLIEKTLGILSCDEETLIVIPEMQAEAIYQIFGVSGIRDKLGIYWNNNKKLFGTTESDESIRLQCGELVSSGMIVGYDNTQTLVSFNPSNYKKIYFLRLPFCNEEDEYLAIQEAGVSIQDKIIVEYRTWKIEILEFVK